MELPSQIDHGIATAQVDQRIRADRRNLYILKGAFGTVRLARLGGPITHANLTSVTHWAAQAGRIQDPTLGTCFWTTLDLRLVAATASFLTVTHHKPKEPVKQGAARIRAILVELRDLANDPDGDCYIRDEALLMLLHLELTHDPTSRNATDAAAMLERHLSTRPKHKGLLLPSVRIRMGISEAKRGHHTQALALLDPAQPMPTGSTTVRDLTPGAVGATVTDAVTDLLSTYQQAQTGKLRSTIRRQVHILCPNPLDEDVPASLALACADFFVHVHREERDLYAAVAAYRYVDAALNKVKTHPQEWTLTARQWIEITDLYVSSTGHRPRHLGKVLERSLEEISPTARRRSYLVRYALRHTNDLSDERVTELYEEALATEPQEPLWLQAYASHLIKLGDIAHAQRVMDRPTRLFFDETEEDQHQLMLSRNMSSLNPDTPRDPDLLAKVVRRHPHEYSLIDSLFYVSPATNPTANVLLRGFVARALNGDGPPMRLVTFVAQTYEQAAAAQDHKWFRALYDGFYRQAEKILIFPGVDPHQLLHRLQGFAAAAAAALITLGQASLAAEVLERGRALQSRLQAAQNAEHKPGQRHAPPLRARFEDIRAVSARLDRALVYLISTASTGFALIVESNLPARASHLPDLTTEAVRDLRRSLTPAGTARVRGPRGQGEPGATEVAAALNVLAQQTAKLRVREAILIPVGATAALPWHATRHTNPAGTTISTIAPSATLMLHARKTPPRSGPGEAIGGPSPITFSHGGPWPDLRWARIETEDLAHLTADRPAIDKDATKEAFTDRVSKPSSQFLHVATHGYMHIGSHESYLLWADPSTTHGPTRSGPKQTASSVTEIQRLPRTPSLIFLAACWAGATTDELPDEVISFPTAFLTAGAKTVIAPLWPVNDEATERVTAQFYVAWTEPTTGLTAEEALHQAIAELKTNDTFAHSTTWAAFTIFGDPELTYTQPPAATPGW